MQELFTEYEKLLSVANGMASPGTLEKIRDLTLVNLLGDLKLVIACDSNASNGEKPNDYSKNSYEEVAISALKVPLMEVLAIGATPILVANNLCIEMDTSGRRIIKVMQKELQESGLFDNLHLTGSTEDNMPTTQSGVGVTVIGLLDSSKSKLMKTQKGDSVVCVGIPQSGIDVPYSEKDYSVCKISTLIKLLKLEYVHEILPIGSKGAEYESNELARCVGLSFHKEPSCSLDLLTSAGSCTAVLASISGENFERIVGDIDIPTNIIGKIY